jgi:hypothetical protein
MSTKPGEVQSLRGFWLAAASGCCGSRRTCLLALARALASAGSPIRSMASASRGSRCGNVWRRFRSPNGWARARSAAVGRSPRTVRSSARRPEQHVAVASARSLARTRAAGQLAGLWPLAPRVAGRSPGLCRRCASASPDELRRIRELSQTIDQGTRGRDRRPGRRDRPAAALRAWRLTVEAAKLLGEIEIAEPAVRRARGEGAFRAPALRLTARRAW